jgi:hypothetical protein
MSNWLKTGNKKPTAPLLYGKWTKRRSDKKGKITGIVKKCEGGIQGNIIRCYVLTNG